MGLLTLLRGLWLLRRPEALRLLGDLSSQAAEQAELRQAYPGVSIDPDVVVQGWREAKLTLGDGVRIEKGAILALGDDHNGYGTLAVGANTWIGQYNNFRLANHADISIGQDCLISQFCSLVAANHRLDRGQRMRLLPSDGTRRGITLGNDVWLGVGVTILPGVTVAEGAVIGANSVINRDVPAYEIWAGSPARKIGERQ
jgi:carbonic anhydrase/acetyltransferase-like protein (isoleucine patch superfamily)